MKKLIVANWKVFLGRSDSLSLAKQLVKIKTSANVVVCPSFPYIYDVNKIIADNFHIGAQDCASKDTQSFTGAINVQQLKELECKYCIVGHSERRMYAHETASEIHDKIALLIEKKITPIFCIGEDKISHMSNKTEEVIAMHLDEVGFKIDWKKVVIAYEPIWSIGTGITPKNSEIKAIADLVKNKVSPKAVLYGGSVSSSNIHELNKIKSVDGFLIGSASTRSDEMSEILAAY